MIFNASNINSLWCNLIIDELVRNGISYYCISPGSRSSPLIVATAQNAKAKKIICYDERGAAYHALGYARATGNPAVVISTSGTAAANYYPAIIEASQDCVPLIVLTADRPPELRNTGANQTIDQVHLYGSYVRLHIDMPCPDEKIAPEVVLTTTDQAVFHTLNTPQGPVHLNCMFREPLAPVQETISGSYNISIQDWLNDEKPYTRYVTSVLSVEQSEIESVSEILSTSKRPLCLVGRLRTDSERNTVMGFARKLQVPLFADIASELRLSANKLLIRYYDRMLLSEKFCDKYVPDTIIHIGSQPVSKNILQLIETNLIENYIIVKDHAYRHDPTHKTTLRITSSVETFCEQLKSISDKNNDDAWYSILNSLSQKAGIAIERTLSQDDMVTEPGVARYLSENVPGHCGLFLGSSMPIRDMDMFGGINGFPINVGANRGASGIDGTLSSAMGFAEGLKKNVTLITGDIAFFHDMNALVQLNRLSQQLIIIVINNNGGGIFSFLPIAEYPDVFEEYFGTPHNTSFKTVAEQFECAYYNPKSMSQFDSDYQALLISGESGIIEVQTDRIKNRTLHSKLNKAIVKEMEK